MNVRSAVCGTYVKTKRAVVIEAPAIRVWVRMPRSGAYRDLWVARWIIPYWVSGVSWT